MSRPDLTPSLEAAAREVGQAIQSHARVVRDEPDNVKRVVDAGEELRSAVLRYESALKATSGWANPIRHLGRLRMYLDDSLELKVAGPGMTGPSVRVTATYRLSIDDEQALYNFVEGRGSERPSSVESAVRYLVESDGWDVLQYPPGRIRLIVADVEVVADESH